jgi:hypothetical protein
MFYETTYPGYLGELAGSAFQAAVAAGYTGSKSAWRAGQTPMTPTPSTGGTGGSTNPPASTGSPQAGTLCPAGSIPTTEPNSCPAGMTYIPPAPGSGTGCCSGSIAVGGAPAIDPSTGLPVAGGSSITSLLGSIPSTYWLIGGAILLFVMLKK